MTDPTPSSTAKAELKEQANINEMLLKFMKKIEQNQIKSDENFQDKYERNQTEIKQQFQEVREEFQYMKEQFTNRIDKQINKWDQISEKFYKDNETVTPTEIRVTSSQKRRIRKVRVLNSYGISITKFQKQVKANKVGRVKKSNGKNVINDKRNTPNKGKKNAENRKLRKDNKVTNYKVLRTNRHKDKTQNRSEKNKTRNSGVAPTRRLRESVFINFKNSNEITIFQNEKLIEKLTNDSNVKRKGRHKTNVGKCRNGQVMQYLFQKGIKLAGSFHKVKNWPKLEIERATNKNVPFKMKRKLVVAKSKKMKVRVKVNRTQDKCGKPRCKIK
jgi:hypothetical protein